MEQNWLFTNFCAFLVCVSASTYAIAQAPSAATLNLSLKTMSKALAGCRVSYTRTSQGEDKPLLESVVGRDNYAKDLKSLGHAETFVNALVAHPDKVTGKILVAILSATDDFSIGVGSTRAEVLRHLVTDNSKASKGTELVVASEALDNCQRSLFDAGDDYVEIVMNYVGAEDDALASKTTRARPKR